MTRNSKGCLMMALPPIVLLGILILWSVISFIAGSLGFLLGGEAGTIETAVVALRLLSVGIGYIGILSVIAVPLFIIIGLIYILTAPKPVIPPEPPQSPTPPSDTNTQTPA